MRPYFLHPQEFHSVQNSLQWKNTSCNSTCTDPITNNIIRWTVLMLCRHCRYSYHCCYWQYHYRHCCYITWFIHYYHCCQNYQCNSTYFHYKDDSKAQTQAGIRWGMSRSPCHTHRHANSSHTLTCSPSRKNRWSKLKIGKTHATE